MNRALFKDIRRFERAVRLYEFDMTRPGALSLVQKIRVQRIYDKAKANILQLAADKEFIE